MDSVLLGNNQIEDVRWLCSLSESELDMLISLKNLVLRRAKYIGHDVLAEKFDLKMLRALGLTLMEYLKGQVKDLPVSSGLVESTEFLNRCNLLKSNLNDNFGAMSIEELKPYISTDRLKRVADGLCEDVASKKKVRLEDPCKPAK